MNIVQLSSLSSYSATTAAQYMCTKPVDMYMNRILKTETGKMENLRTARMENGNYEAKFVDIGALFG